MHRDTFTFRCGQHAALTLEYYFTNQLGVIYQKTWIFINTAVRKTDYAKKNHTAYRWLYLHGNVEWCTNTISGHNKITVRLYCTIINLSVVICCYLHNSLTCNIRVLTLCYKMSVSHICNVVLGGLENIYT